MKPVPKSIKLLSKNKYAIILAVYAVWLLFFDQDDFFSRRKVAKEVQELETTIQFYRDQVVELEKQKASINEDSEVLEKLAREKFYMAKPGEDVFVFVR